MSEPIIQKKPAGYVRPNVEGQIARRAFNEVYVKQPAGITFRLGEKLKVYDIAAEKIGADAKLTYLEFGVHKGWSIARIAERFSNLDAKFVGFDSFEGLPEAWLGKVAGHFSTGGVAPKTRDPRTEFVKGWFQDTLPGYLASTKLEAPLLVHFDADLYSSTLFLLTTLWHHAPEYYFLYDEFVPHEVVALYDFMRAYPVEFEFYAATVNDRGAPWQVLGHIRNVPFRLPVDVPQV